MSYNKAVIVLSGGMDSVTTLAYSKNKNFICYAITFNYGQKSFSEIDAAKYFAKKYGCIEHKIFEIDFKSFTSSALISDNINISESKTTGIPNTYVPMRNLIFLSIACSWAEKLNIFNIFIGANAVDYSGYPDCRDEFLTSFENTVNLGSKSGDEYNKINIYRPLVNMKKIDIIRLGQSLGIDYTKTVSCYQATIDGKACGFCDSCKLRRNAFVDNNIPDQTLYI